MAREKIIIFVILIVYLLFNKYNSRTNFNIPKRNRHCLLHYTSQLEVWTYMPVVQVTAAKLDQTDKYSHWRRSACCSPPHRARLTKRPDKFIFPIQVMYLQAAIFVFFYVQGKSLQLVHLSLGNRWICFTIDAIKNLELCKLIGRSVYINDQ